jgi:glycosyltransferase involved in cell wall biosynthesis
VNGLIVPRKDSQRLAEAVLKLLMDEKLRARLGRAGLERVRENFSFERLAQDMMRIYDRVLAQEAIKSAIRSVG